ncbi:MAG TPA: dual specificity protein phosphatase [Myxococcota bacterium]|nr:dual specificity protein phosphatase [Myxococcota bacterium]
MRMPLAGHPVLRIALAALVLVGLVAAASSHLPGIYRTPDRWTEARKGWLFRSAQIPASDVEQVLRAQKIDLVLDLTDAAPDPLQDAEARAAQRLGIRYLHLPVQHPRERVIENLAAAVTEIDRAHKAGQRVLVHCTYGHRRSATALALYARLIEQEPPHIAFAELTRFSEADSKWSHDAITWVDKNMDAIAAAVKADEAAADAGASIPNQAEPN